jgi:hypothetical protein
MALRTIRLYPTTNPQVQRTNELVMQIFQALMDTGEDDWISLAVADKKLLVCGELLTDKNQERPQIQGLLALFARSKIHSLSFLPPFSVTECLNLTQTLSILLEGKAQGEPIAALQQPTRSAPVLIAATRQILDQRVPQASADSLGLPTCAEILEQYDCLLSREKHLQIADQGGAQLAEFNDQELVLLPVQRYKNLLGEHPCTSRALVSSLKIHWHDWQPSSKQWLRVNDHAPRA